METTRYDELRTLVAANFSETTQRLVDEALAYAAECLEKQVRYDGSPLLDHAAGVARIVISEIGLGRNSHAGGHPARRGAARRLRPSRAT